MTTKQVKTVAAAVEAKAPEVDDTISQKTIGTIVNNGANDPAQAKNNNLFVSVKTFNHEGRTIGERIVDMYHFGTRNWLQNHHWWAMHNGHCVETNVATDDEITGYLSSAKLALAAKFNDKTEAVAA